jgi:hypothetical protein
MIDLAKLPVSIEQAMHNELKVQTALLTEIRDHLKKQVDDKLAGAEKEATVIKAKVEAATKPVQKPSTGPLQVKPVRK